MLFNCKKYPEGGCERRGPKNIIGDWKLSLYEVNGIDSTDLINYNGSDGYKKIKITKLNTTDSDYNLRIDNSVGIGFSFINKNKDLEINSSYESKYCPTISSSSNCYRIIFSPEGGTTRWNIMSLTKNELVITANLSNSYKINLVK